MNTRTLMACLACTMMSAAAVASAPFRDGLPPTLTPAAPMVRNPAPDALAMFSTSYVAAKRPRIAIYWNRELDDQLAARYEDYTSRRATDEVVESTTQDETRVEHGATSISDHSTSREKRSETAQGTRLLAAKTSRAGAAESIEWRLESAFLNPFLSAGVELIDRNVTMRMLASAGTPDSRPDVQRIEASALAGKADLLMEVLMTPDADSPIGCRFRVTVKDVRSGAIVGLLSTRAIPSTETTSRWVPGPGGFRKVTTTETPVLEQFGERLAQEAMFHLANRWNARS